MLVKPEEPEQYVLIRSLTTDELFVISAGNWADYGWEMKGKPPRFELVISGEKGYLTMLEQLANAEDGSTEETK